MKLVIIVSLLGVSLFAQSAVTPAVTDKPAAKDTPYGIQLGTIAGSIGGGVTHIGGVGGIHPGIKAGLEVGVHKYLGIFADGGWSRASGSAGYCSYGYCSTVSARANYYQLGAGLEVVGTNHSRIVPYAKVGMAYVGAAGSANVSGGGFYASASAYQDLPAAQFGGGVRAYLTHHIGIDAQVTALRTLGHNGGATILAPTVGVFFQSK